MCAWAPAGFLSETLVTMVHGILATGRSRMRRSNTPTNKCNGYGPSGRCEEIDLAEIYADAKCMPTPQRSLTEHPGATFF
jgi:hypothetical protein